MLTSPVVLLTERKNTGGRVVACRSYSKQCVDPLAVLPVPLVLLRSALITGGRIATAACVVRQQRLRTSGRVVVLSVIASRGLQTVAVFSTPLVLLRSALSRGSIDVAGRIAKRADGTIGRVVRAHRIAQKRRHTRGRVFFSVVEYERSSTNASVVAGGRS